MNVRIRRSYSRSVMPRCAAAPTDDRLFPVKAHAPHAVAAIVGDEQRAVRQLEQPDRAAPGFLLIVVTRDEPGQEILRWSDRFAVLEGDADDAVASQRGSVDGSMQRDESML